MTRLTDIAAALGPALGAETYAGIDDPAGIWLPSDRPIAALGLALEPWPGIGAWAASERLDALLVHRPWGLAAEAIGPIGVLAYHLAFDESLTIGRNPRLASILGLSQIETLGRKEGRPIGMIGDATGRRDRFVAAVERVFGGLDRVVPGERPEVGRVAVVGAMTAALVEEAARRGADAYVTGQWREPGRAAAAAAGLTVVAVGHRRSELWGLGALAALLGERWPALRIVTAVP